MTTTQPTNLQAMLELAEAEFAATLAAFPTMRAGQVHQTGQGIAMHVALVHYAKGVAVEDVLARTAVPEMVVLTSDGREANFNEWHEGEFCGSTDVYYERWTVEGRVAHGWIDATSRCLTQCG